MLALKLDPEGYAGSYKLVGGRPALDLVNTVSWPESRAPHDWLGSLANLQRWLGAVGLPRAPGGVRHLSAVVEVRSVLSAVLRPLARGERPARSAVEALSQAVARAAVRRVIDPSVLTWSWKAPASTRDALAPVLWDGAELVAAGERARLRCCPACAWLFEDHTRNGKRRWCDMADCGSRDKARRYYRRRAG